METSKELRAFIETTSNFIVEHNRTMKTIIADSKEELLSQIKALENSNDDSCKQAVKTMQNALQAFCDIENIANRLGNKKKIDDNKILEMRASGMTQEAIARELNVSLSSVVRAERNKRIADAANGVLAETE